jgi:dTDP-4-amino-4,6-dideoxygalactose transaminase
MHGMEPKYFHQVIGGNFRLDALQAALLGVKLPHFDGYTARRRRNAALYTERLGQLPSVIVARAEDCGCLEAHLATTSARLVLPVAYPHCGHIWNQYTVRVPGAGRRDALRAHLTAKGIGSEIYYPLPLHEQACYAPLGYRPVDFPVAHRLAGEVLSLPIYPELGAEQIEHVCAAIAEFCSGGL